MRQFCGCFTARDGVARRAGEETPRLKVLHVPINQPHLSPNDSNKIENSSSKMSMENGSCDGGKLFRIRDLINQSLHVLQIQRKSARESLGKTKAISFQKRS